MCSGSYLEGGEHGLCLGKDGLVVLHLEKKVHTLHSDKTALNGIVSRKLATDFYSASSLAARPGAYLFL